MSVHFVLVGQGLRDLFQSKRLNLKKSPSTLSNALPWCNAVSNGSHLAWKVKCGRRQCYWLANCSGSDLDFRNFVHFICRQTSHCVVVYLWKCCSAQTKDAWWFKLRSGSNVCLINWKDDSFLFSEHCWYGWLTLDSSAFQIVLRPGCLI